MKDKTLLSQVAYPEIAVPVREFCVGISKAFSSIIGVDLHLQNRDTLLDEVEKFSTQHTTIATVPFSGGVTGEFFICVCKSDWAPLLAEISGLSPDSAEMAELLNSTFQEIINTAAGEAIGAIKANFGVVTMLSPRLIEGTLDYPATRLYNFSFLSDKNHSIVEARLSLDLMEQEINVEHERLKKDSRLDVTGLFNKKHFIETLAEVEKRFERSGYFSVIFADINRLKYINDTYGHDAGDAYIQAACNILRQSCRYSDFCFRIGGDELVIILPKCMKEDIIHVLRRIESLTSIAHIEVQDSAGRPVQVGVNMSIGYASNSEPGIGVSDVLKTADSRMEENKREWYKTQNISRRN
ncbi:MAG: diguanylate cyclase [Deltaproteobacteria bacterium]|nr:diguanylate cyclase [Deltaproteobacteria bacterium]